MTRNHHSNLSATDRGLWIGNDLIQSNDVPVFKAARSARADRLSLKLAIAFRRRLSPEIVKAVVEAADIACCGDVALANIKLAFAGLPRVPGAADLSDRLAAVDHLLAHGMMANELMEELGYGARSDDFVRFDPNHRPGCRRAAARRAGVGRQVTMAQALPPQRASPPGSCLKTRRSSPPVSARQHCQP